jgi:hypothetical protein
MLHRSSLLTAEYIVIHSSFESENIRMGVSTPARFIQLKVDE